MAELDELLAGALRDLAAEAPGLPPLSPRSRRRIRAPRAAAILASVAAAAGVCAGLVMGALALSRTARLQPSSPGPSLGLGDQYAGRGRRARRGRVDAVRRDR